MAPVTGIDRGIAHTHLPRIFHPVDGTQPPDVGSSPEPSIGFGIVHEHGGPIQVTSQPRQGAPIIVGLPTRDARDSAAMAD